MKIVIDPKETEAINKAATEYFKQRILDWSPETDPQALGLFGDIFRKGYQTKASNGAIVTVKLTREKLKNMIGKETYDEVMTLVTSDMEARVFAYILSICCGCVFSYTMKRNFAGLLISAYGGQVVGKLAYPQLRNSIIQEKMRRKEAISNDERIQEDRGIQGQVSDMPEQGCPA